MKIKSVFGILLIAALAFTSCQKEELELMNNEVSQKSETLTRPPISYTGSLKAIYDGKVWSVNTVTGALSNAVDLEYAGNWTGIAYDYVTTKTYVLNAPASGGSVATLYEYDPSMYNEWGAPINYVSTLKDAPYHNYDQVGDIEFDYSTGVLYCLYRNKLAKITDVSTGMVEVINSNIPFDFGTTPLNMQYASISLSCSKSGNLYAITPKTGKIYQLDKTTGNIISTTTYTGTQYDMEETAAAVLDSYMFTNISDRTYDSGLGSYVYYYKAYRQSPTGTTRVFLGDTDSKVFDMTAYYPRLLPITPKER